LSIAIMAHPSRTGYVAELHKALGPVPVAWHDGPDATRTDHLPIWRTRRAALLLADPAADFHCLLQDDAIPTADFRARAEALVDQHGDRLYALFYRRTPRLPEVHQVAMRSVRRGWFAARGYIRGVGVVVATERIPDLVAFGDAIGGHRGDDYRMKHWAIARGIETIVPIPSLVDHRPGPSLAGHNGERRAWRFTP
jgi:hypothetical protein